MADAVHPLQLELERITKIASDLLRTLKAQRDLLQQRGMVLSSEPLDELQSVHTRLQQLSGQLVGEQVEVQQLLKLAQTTELVNSTLDLDQILNFVVDAVIELTGSERGYIILRNFDTDDLEFRVARAEQLRSLSPAEVTVSRTVVDYVAANGQLMVTTDAAGDNRFSDSDSIFDMALRSILCVPLVRKGVLTGMIYTDSRIQAGIFGAREQALVQAFADQVAVAIENARLFESVRVSLNEITEARNLMDNVFASIASGVITTDADDRIQTFNAAAARILDVPLDECLGRPIWDVLPSFYDGFERQFRAVQQDKIEDTVEAEPIIRSRGQVSLNLRISPLKGDEMQSEGGVAIVLNDVTELKQRNAQLSTIRRYLSPAMVDNIQAIDSLQLGGEEREVSILSCDVRGFTTFSESLEPEEIMQVINQYLTVGSDAIHLCEGIIDKYIGDAMIGLFNTQLNPQEGHALLAVRAALTMVSDVEALHETLPEKYHVFYGVGVHTGPAILGNVGSPSRKEFTAVGDSIQYAKFLQENALGGQVLISQETYALVSSYFTVERVTAHRALSYDTGAPIYRITGLKRAG